MVMVLKNLSKVAGGFTPFQGAGLITMRTSLFNLHVPSSATISQAGGHTWRGMVRVPHCLDLLPGRETVGWLDDSWLDNMGSYIGRP